MADHKRPLESPLPPSKKQRFLSDAESSGTKNDPVVDYKVLLENEANRRPMVNYMEEVQTSITTTMRAELIEWLSDVSESYWFSPETLFLAVSYMDQYLSRKVLSGSGIFQLLAASSMFIAAKHEGIEPLSPESLLCEKAHYSYTVEQLGEMQSDVLTELKDEMGISTVISFLGILTKISKQDYKTSSLQLEFLSNYFAELSLIEYRCLGFVPSMIASAVTFLSRFTIKQTSHPWNLSLENISGYKASQMKECVQILLAVQLNKQVGSGIREKYTRTNLCRANLSTPEAIPSVYFEDAYDYDETVYSVDIHKYLQAMENEANRRPMAGYIEQVQKDLNAEMRVMLVEWLSEIAEIGRCGPEALFLSVSYIDRYLSVRNLSTRNIFQLLGASSLLIAARYEEQYSPNPEFFCMMSAGAFTKEQLLKMQDDVLGALNYEMGNPTIMSFLSTFTRIAQEDLKTPYSQLEFLSFYFAELSLIVYRFLEFLPSMVAASITFLSRFTLTQTTHPWNLSLESISGYKASQIKECVRTLHGVHVGEKAGKYIRKKYKRLNVCRANLHTQEAIPSIFFEDACSANFFRYLQSMENVENGRPRAGYMEQVQRCITEGMRAVLIEWLFEVAEDRRFVQESLFRTVSYIDRYLSVRVLPRQGLFQLLAVSSMLIATKYETEPASVEYFCGKTHYSYTVEEAKEMQSDVSAVIQDEMRNPTVISFLRILTSISEEDYKTWYLQLELLSNYLAELSLIEYRCLEFVPSMIASAITFLSRFIVKQTTHPWNLSLESISGYKPSQIKECVQILLGVLLNKQVGRGIREKYRSTNLCWANLSTPEAIPMVFFEDAYY